MDARARVCVCAGQRTTHMEMVLVLCNLLSSAKPHTEVVWFGLWKVETRWLFISKTVRRSEKRNVGVRLEIRQICALLSEIMQAKSKGLVYKRSIVDTGFNVKCRAANFSHFFLMACILVHLAVTPTSSESLYLSFHLSVIHMWFSFI